MKHLPTLFALLSVIYLLSCEKEADLALPVVQQPVPDNETPQDPQSPPPATSGEVTVFEPGLMDDNYILVNDAGANRVYLMDKQGVILHEWELTHNIGNDVYLLDDGRLLASLESDDPQILLGGQGGQLQFIGVDGKVEWSFTYSSEEAELHHDADLLPNGNILAMVWEKLAVEDAKAAGSSADMDLYLEALIEIDPNTDTIVWEWHAWDHLVQDHDASKGNYGNVEEDIRKIDLNYVSNEKGDIMHANGIAYDPVNDLIYLSVNFYNEVWVIDHSTSSDEAKDSSGGVQGVGGDLVYRFGNPEAYRNTSGTTLFHRNHHPNLLSNGNMLIYSNGSDQSTVYELEFSSPFYLVPGADNEPAVTWSFTHPDLFSPKVSGAVLLENGNILITEGDFGIWEVNREGQIIWKYHAPGFFWRAYHYKKDHPGIEALGL